MSAARWLGVVMALIVVGAAVVSAQEVTPTPIPAEMTPELIQQDAPPLETPPPVIDEAVCAAFLPEGETGSAPFFVGLGNAYFEQGAYTRAITTYSCAINRDDTYAPAFVRRGYAHTIQRNDPQALEDYTRALELDETLIEGYINRGVLYTNQGNFGLAIDDFTLALAFAPDNVAALHNRAIVHAIEGNYEFALEDLDEAIFYAPEMPELYSTLGAVHLALAVQNYAQFTDLAGASVPVPGGGSSVILDSLNRATVTGEFGAWLALLIPAER